MSTTMQNISSQQTNKQIKNLNWASRPYEDQYERDLWFLNLTELVLCLNLTKYYEVKLRVKKWPTQLFRFKELLNYSDLFLLSFVDPHKFVQIYWHKA